MDLMVCVGSSCHLKGSREVIGRLEALMSDYKLAEKLSLKGSFCMGRCTGSGVSVKFDDKYYSILPDGVDDFFIAVILPAFKMQLG
ncbi:MAG: (2Fe-2S) ferredoxin domain-containing protein [Bacillota bacterium]|nr:(2Fe-2S) ferredoxin domain-containing protein [Bacillota bacterium]